jgi:hypothetical protein
MSGRICGQWDIVEIIGELSMRSKREQVESGFSWQKDPRISVSQFDVG